MSTIALPDKWCTEKEKPRQHIEINFESIAEAIAYSEPLIVDKYRRLLSDKPLRHSRHYDSIENVSEEELSLLRSLTPNNELLLELAKRNPPPASWYAEGDE